MKLNFGVKIVVFYILFISLILTLVIKCYNNKVDLVTNDYYAKELVFQNKLDALNRDIESNHSFNYSFNSKEIVFELDSLLNNKKVTKRSVFHLIDLTEEWNEHFGGAIHYINGTGDFTKISVEANKLILFTREDNTHRFVKYVNCNAKNKKRLFLIAKCE